MKKLICLFAVLLAFLFVQTMNAQIKIGAVAGLNSSDLEADTEIKSRNLFGIGFILQKIVNDQFSIIAEPMYLQKGGILPAKDGSPELKIKGSFIELPIFLKYSILNSKKFNPYLIAGPYVGLKLSMDLDGETAGVAFTADLDPVTKTFDSGLGIGVGIEIPLETSSIFLEGRYSMGLIDLHKDGTFQIRGGGLTIEEKFDDDNKFETRGIQIMLGATFSFGK